jgi:peptide/nickel transport system substrate-binding protein
MSSFHKLLIAAGLALAAATVHAQQTLRWAPQTGVATLDPHASGDFITRNVLLNVYEGLVRFDKDMKVEPELALSWTQTSPTVMRFKLRPGVVFHDGSRFSADDVVFSFKRATSGTSDIRAKLRAIKDMRKVDELTADVETHTPSPTLLRELLALSILSRSWSEKNQSVEPADNRRSGKENFATRNANGTGPFRLTVYETDVRIEFAPHDKWWDKREHNISKVVLTPIGAAATRIAALVSGQVDLITTVSVQDEPRLRASPDLQTVRVSEARVVYLGFDQSRDELLYSSVKGKNPFKDARVRKAFAHAVDVQMLRDKVMRGAAVPVGAMIPASVEGWDASFAQRPAYDVTAAKKLLAEAGYPAGFNLTLDCPNEGYVNVEQLCVAIAGMLGHAGIKIDLSMQPRTQFFGKIGRRDTSFFIHSWGTNTFDAHATMDLLMFTPGKGVGTWNVGGYSNPEVDKLISAIASEMNPAKRHDMMVRVLKLHRDEVGAIPLHQQVLTYGTTKKVHFTPRPDDAIQLRWVRMQ